MQLKEFSVFLSHKPWVSISNKHILLPSLRLIMYGLLQKSIPCVTASTPPRTSNPRIRAPPEVIHAGTPLASRVVSTLPCSSDHISYIPTLQIIQIQSHKVEIEGLATSIGAHDAQHCNIEILDILWVNQHTNHLLHSASLWDSPSSWWTRLHWHSWQWTMVCGIHHFYLQTGHWQRINWIVLHHFEGQCMVPRLYC